MSLYQLFPPPEYLSMTAMGLDLSDRSFKFLSFSRDNNVLRLDKFGRKDLPEGIIAGGLINKRDELISFLNSERKQAGIKYAVVSLPEERAFLHVAQLPKMDDGKVREAIEMQLEEIVPLPSADTAFDIKILPANGADHIDVLVAAYSKATINEYNSVFQAAGIIPLSFEIEAQSLARAVASKEVLGTVMIIDFGKTRTSFLIVCDGNLRFSSTINITGESLEKAIVKNLGVDMQKAEKLKKDRGIMAMGDGDDVVSALLPIITSIKEEAEKGMNFWEGHADHIHGERGTKIEKIILCGGDANLRGLTEYLSNALKIKAELANVWTNVASFEEIVPEILFNESLSYATAVGLGLRALEL
jgi:type IV pilus assembly protein PilM